MKLSIIILAAGKGTRMNSNTPKVLHKISGYPMVEHVLQSVQSYQNDAVEIKDVVIVTSEILEDHSSFKKIISQNKHLNIKTVTQRERLGTGHAVWTGLSECDATSEAVLVMYGDTPLIQVETIEKLIGKFSEGVVGTAFEHKGDSAYGRLQFNQNGKFISIIEYKELLDPENHSLCNAGMLIADFHLLKEFLDSKCKTINSNQEIYLTDIFAYAANTSEIDYVLIDENEALGINTRLELAAAESVIQDRIRKKMIENGVTLIAPDTVFFSIDTNIAPDTVVHPYVRFGSNVSIGSGSEVRSFCDIEGVEIGDDVMVGPFARIRPGTIIADNCKVGNFVELKNAELSQGAKAVHLTYIGDARIGENTNIGAGTIFCNYDGINKHTSTVGKNTLIGANTSIISPINIGDNAIVGAGSVVTQNIMDNELCIARANQVNKKKK